ncbi:RHS repeat protein [Puniceicoccus vermicola]|uniref:RHS repeat protein n=1 Tax=Puniceicoccus vermicola TaxID=388746 RepID=A0A7X1E6X0_9BACT|nr:RHS repeat protein [Puniceicoccus vermicola]MBC2603082.1 RHS repeat protein [Puniceicoccus vermicola]
MKVSTVENILRLGGAFFCFAVLSSIPSYAQVSLPYEVDFEEVEGYFVDDLPLPFIVTGTASVTTLDSFSGSQSVLLLPGQTGAVLDLSFNGAAVSSIQFVDFFLKPVFTPTASLPAFANPGSVAMTAVVGESDGVVGEVWAANGAGLGDAEWLETGWDVSATEGTADQWIRFTYRLDYAAGLWDLYLNNSLVLADLTFLDLSATSLSSFQLRGDLDKDIFFDYFYAGGVNPLFEDEDQDGIDDDYESSHGLSTSIDDRDDDPDFDALSNIEEYLNGLSAGSSDTDGDGIPDGIEIAEGTDPLVADRDGLASLPFSENFESDVIGFVPFTSFNTPLGGASLLVTDQEVAPEGLKSLQIENFDDADGVVQYFAGSGESVIWLDFNGRLGWFPDGEVPEISKGSAGVFYQREDGRFLALDGQGDGGGVYHSVGSEADPDSWRRITVRLDYGSQSWSLWVDDVRVASEYGFAWNSPYLSRFKATGVAGSEIGIDAVSISTEEPLGLDDDGDGMDSMWERQFGLDPDDPSDADLDSDGDHWIAVEEYRLELDPNSPEASVLPYFDGFERYPNGTNLDGQNQWVLPLGTGTAVPGRQEAFEGAQSLGLAGSAEGTVVAENHFMAPFENIVTVRMVLKPQGISGNGPEITSDTTSAFFFNQDGILTYYDGSTENWTPSTHGAIDFEKWQKVSMEMDYSGETYSIWLNEAVLVEDVAFASPAAEFKKLRLIETSEENSWIDGIAIFPSAERDFDGMGDSWEILHFGDLSQNGEDDYDGDSLSNRLEYEYGTDPTSTSDSEPDGMPDEWEIFHGLNVGVDDGDLDKDGDGLSNLLEFQNGTNPTDIDSDNDGLSDGREIEVGTQTLIMDSDGDGLFDGSEVDLFGTNPLLKDSDSDGFNDRMELVVYNTDPNNPGSRPLASGPITSPVNVDPPAGTSYDVYYGVKPGGGYRFGRLIEVSIPRKPVGRGWAVSESEFVPDYSVASQELYYSALGSSAPHDEVFIFTTQEFPFWPVGKGWVTGTNTIHADLSIPSRDIYSSPLDSPTELIFSNSPSGGERVGKGWITGVNRMEPDYFVPSQTIYYGPAYVGATTYTYRTESLIPNHQVDAGRGWVVSDDKISPDYSVSWYTVYDGKLSLFSPHNAVSTLYRSGGANGQVEGAGWITSPFTFDQSDVFSDNPSAIWAYQNGFDFYNDKVVNTAKGRNGDFDNDGFSNGEEYQAGTDPRDPNSSPVHGSGDLNEYLDSDDDGLIDLLEISIGTDPYYFDTDGDLLPDGFEHYSAHLDPLVPENNIHLDFDGDGLSDFEESNYGTNPDLWDTDGDGVSDGIEMGLGSNPRDYSEKPFVPSDFYGPDLDDANAEPIGDLGGGYGASPSRYSIEGEIGDHSGSHSERWRLQIGEFHATSDGFGIVSDYDLNLRSDRYYEVSLHHEGTNADEPDYDYTATVDPTGFVLVDMDGLLGTVDDSFGWSQSKAYLVPIGGIGYSESYSGGDAVGPRYRKVALNGRPLSDEKPEEEDESDSAEEETYVDAFDLSLHHDTSLVYVPVGASDFVLQVNASSRETSWSNRSGLRPHEQLTLPFGVGWNSNLCAYVEVVEVLGDNTDDPTTVNVIDENGRSQRFGTPDMETFFPWPSSRVDRKTYLNQLKISEDGEEFTLIKKFGTEVRYLKSDAWFMYTTDRVGGSYKVRRHTYWRLDVAKDRYENQIKYDYGTSGVSLIPERIRILDRTDSSGDFQDIHINRSEDARRVESIADPRGNVISFDYTLTNSISGSTSDPVDSDSLSYEYPTLDEVHFPDGTSRSYTYEVASDREYTDSRTTWHYHANLKTVTDKNANTYTFNYDFDRTKEYYSGGGGITGILIPRTAMPADIYDAAAAILNSGPTQGGSGSGSYKKQYGLPRHVSSVVLPGGIGTSTFSKTEDTLVKFGREFEATSGTVVTDVLDNETTYAFEGVHGEVVDDDSVGSAVSLEWMVYYTEMTITHPDELGTESFVFDLPSGLSLRSMTDFSGNTTTWDYEDALDPEHIVPVLESEPTFMTTWADPTRKTDALGRVETYQYGNYRVMSQVVDVFGTTTEWTVDSLGRRIDKTVTGRQSNPLLRESYTYDNPAFPGFMTFQATEAFANRSGKAWEEDLVTQFVPDEYGRVLLKIVDPGGLDLSTEYTYDQNNNRESVEDSRSYTTNFYYDSLNRLIRTDFPAAGTSNGIQVTSVRRLYDPRGNLVCEVDEEGRYTFHEYDELSRRVKTIRDMDDSGLPTLPSISEPQILEIGNRGTATAQDLVTEFTYNQVNSLTSTKDPRDVITRHFYDAIQRVRHTYSNFSLGDADEDGVESGSSVYSDADKTHTEYLYQTERNPGVSAFDSEGFKPTQIIQHDAVQGISGTWTLTSDFFYDADYREVENRIEYEPGQFAETTTEYGNILNGKEALVITITDPIGKVSKSFRDGLGRVVESRDAVGSADQIVTETLYSSTGLVWRTIDPRGARTESDYDAAGRPVKVWQPDPDTGLVSAATSPMTETIYDDAGNVHQSINPRGKVWIYNHDARNRKISETAPAFLDKDGLSKNPVTVFSYDGVGNVILKQDPLGLVTTTDYDHANRPYLATTSAVPVFNSDTGTVSSEVLQTETEYDGNGNPVRVTDSNGSRTVNFYDALNRMTASATNPDDGDPSTTEGAPSPGDIVVSYLYDDAGNRILVEDGEGALTAFRYDGMGRNTRTIWDFGSELQRTKTVNFDEVVMTSRTDEKGQVTNYFYDDLHRLEDVSNVGRSVDNRHYEYDNNGNILSISYPYDPATHREVVNEFDFLNRVTEETSAGVTHGYKYDKAGNTLEVTYGLTSRQIISTYDDLNRLKTMTEGGRATEYFYDEDGNVTRKELANGVTVESVYDLLGRKKTSTKTAPGATDPFSSYTYAHDGVGNLCEIQEAYPGGQLTYREVRNAYDHTYRLDTETILSGGITTLTDYDYDDANNRIRKGLTEGSDPEEVTTYEYGDGSAVSGGNSNQLVRTILPDQSEVTYTYDANGNRRTRTEGGNIDTYHYDYENRLLSLVYQTGDSDTGTYNYEYDHRTRRVVRDESAITGRELHIVSFSHGLSVQEHIDVVSATPDVEYIRGSDYGGGIGGLLYSLRSGTPSFKHYNSRGDVVAATDASGSLTYQAAYEAFGKHGDTPTSEEWGTNPDPQQANTKDEDPTGLLNEGFRYRDLDTGTFITRDPLGFIDGPNVYTYVVQNPWTFFDPLGLSVQHRYDDEGNLVGHDVNGHYYSRKETEDGVEYQHDDGTVFHSAKDVLDDSARRVEDKKWNGVPAEYRDIVSSSTGMARFRPDEVNDITGEMSGVRDNFTGSPFQMNDMSPFLYHSTGIAFTVETGLSPLIVAPAPMASGDITVYVGMFGKDGLNIVVTGGGNLGMPGVVGDKNDAHFGAYSGAGLDGPFISNSRSVGEFKTINNISSGNVGYGAFSGSFEFGRSDDGSIRSVSGGIFMPSVWAAGANIHNYTSEEVYSTGD